ncbi:MAG: lysophospholipid acyltransferase family protein [Acidobacteriota bacterium]
MIATHLKSLSLFATRWIAGAEGRWPGGEPAAGQRIYCANHTSHLDAVLLMASLPDRLLENTRPVAAAEYWSSGKFRRYLTERVFRTVLIERGGSTLNPLGPAFQALRQGDSLIFFPEGTRGSGESLQPLKPGIYCLARAFRQVEIVPVWIENASRVLPKRAVLPAPALCALHFGAPLSWDGQEDASEFLLRMRTAMEALRRPDRETCGRQ